MALLQRHPSRASFAALGAVGVMTLLLVACGGKNDGPPASTTPAPVAPSITTQPQSLTVNQGASASFTVAATGTPSPTYQWMKAGVDIAGATATTYTLASAKESDAGSYTVKVANTVSSVISSAAVLTVNTLPVITTEPADAAVNAGQAATFKVVAKGTPAPTYQWNVNGTAISGATSDTYTTPVTTASDTGKLYQVTVTNSVGPVTSRQAKLTVSPAQDPVALKTDVADVTVSAGQDATFQVVATGTAPITYKWLENGTAIAGAPNQSSYTVKAARNPEDNGKFYSVEVSNAVNKVTSRQGKLTVTATTPTQQVLLNEATFVTHPGGGLGGADASAVQGGTTGLTSYGMVISGTTRQADEFTIPATDTKGWRIDEMVFYAFEINAATTPSTFKTFTVEIWDGAPNNPASKVVFGNQTTNVLKSSVFANCYRTGMTNLATAVNRPVMANTCTIGTTLLPGTYWVVISGTGTQDITINAVPVTILGTATPPKANALSFTGGVWALALDAGAKTNMALPFKVIGKIL